MIHLPSQALNNNALQIKNQNGTLTAVGITSVLLSLGFLFHEANEFYKTINKPKKTKKRKKKSK